LENCAFRWVVLYNQTLCRVKTEIIPRCINIRFELLRKHLVRPLETAILEFGVGK